MGLYSYKDMEEITIHVPPLGPPTAASLAESARVGALVRSIREAYAGGDPRVVLITGSPIIRIKVVD